MSLHKKNNFVEISKNLAKYLKIILLDYQETVIMLKKDKQNCKKFWYSNNQFEHPI